MNQFGQFLVEQGLAAPEDVVVALDWQRERQKPIGKIALEERMLTMHQIFEILNKQNENPQLRFGKIAVSLGYLTPVQVEMLLVIQREKRPMVGEILVQIGVLDKEAMQQALKKYETIKKYKEKGSGPGCCRAAGGE